MGFHTRGEMGGIWTPPIKLLDGIWFGVNGQWIGPATTFTSGFGYVHMALPSTGGVQLSRTDFAPDGRRAVEIGLTLSAGSQANVNLNALRALRADERLPVGLHQTRPDHVQPARQGRVQRQAARLHRYRNPAGGQRVRARLGRDRGHRRPGPASGKTGADFRGPQDPPVICPVGSEPDMFRCDDTAYGKGAGGELTYPVSVPAGGSRTIWFTVAGLTRACPMPRPSSRRPAPTRRPNSPRRSPRGSG